MKRQQTAKLPIDDLPTDDFRDVNKQLNKIQTLKHQNRIREQQEIVASVKNLETDPKIFSAELISI